jgi:hypothetical protein
VDNSYLPAKHCSQRFQRVKEGGAGAASDPKITFGSGLENKVATLGNIAVIMADAHLYLSPRDLLLSEPPSANVLLDYDYMNEMARRAAVVKQGSLYDQANPREN